MSEYLVKLSRKAEKDREKLLQANLSKKAKVLIDILAESPYQSPPAYEKLVGNLSGFYSRRINIQHRLIYTVQDEEKIVIVRSMWSHYE